MPHASVRVLALLLCAAACRAPLPGPETSSRPRDAIDDRVDALVAQMTLAEKVGQLTLFTTDWGQTGPTIRDGYADDIRRGACGALFNSHTVAFTRELQRIATEETRLKIPLLFGYDVVHGYRTIFPIPLAEAASWNLEAIERSARIAATEAAAAGLHWTFAPMADISRDPRWGRVMEGAGEDPLLGSRVAAARVRGFQGDGLGETDAVMACVKHFAAYGAPVAGREYNAVDMSERQFRDQYLPPYAAAVRAGAATVMTSFNDYDGVPASGNSFLLTDLLRGELGFDGFVVTDYTSINEMVAHGVATDEQAAGELALSAGVDMDMQGAVFQQHLAASIEAGRITTDEVDHALRRVLRKKFELGLFDDPYAFCDEQREREVVLAPAHREAARDVARRSIVLLGNRDETLPIAPGTRIAVVGPLADSQADMLGAWHAAGRSEECISPLAGLRARFGDDVEHVEGCAIDGDDRSAFDAALAAAARADLVVAVVGESAEMSGEAAARAHLGLPGVQTEFVEALAATGKPVVVVLMNGRPLAIPRVAAAASALVEAWWLGSEAGNALADVLSGAHAPSGRLPMSFPRSVGQVPLYYGEKRTGRPFDADSKWTSKYIDEANTPLFPFGFGLGYTTFAYGEPSLDSPTLDPDGAITLRVEVRNTGRRAGTETVQLYVSDLVASVTRPNKQLLDFAQIELAPGEARVVRFEVREPQLRFWRRDRTYGSEPGAFELHVGASSADLQTVRFTLAR